MFWMVNISQNSFRAYTRSPIVTKINDAEKKAKLLKKLRTITNEILSNDLYMSKNMQLQNLQLSKLKIPQWKKDIINEAWDIKQVLALNLLNDLKGLIDDIKKNGLEL